MIIKFLSISFSLSILLVISGCTADRVSMYGRFVGVYGKYDETICSLTKYLNDNGESLIPQEKSAYLLLIGIAYQKKHALTQSMEYYNQSLKTNYEFNYFALLQKANIYSAENDYKNEIKYLNEASQNIQMLLLRIKSNSLPDDEIKRCEALEFIISYYINKDELNTLKQPYPIILEEKIKRIENTIHNIKTKLK